MSSISSDVFNNKITFINTKLQMGPWMLSSVYILMLPEAYRLQVFHSVCVVLMLYEIVAAHVVVETPP